MVRSLTRMTAYKKCALCCKYILDPGYLMLSKVNQDNFTNWCEIMLDMNSKDVERVFKRAWACRFCIWDARFYHENAKGNENTVWWSTNDAIYNYYVANMIKPCEVQIQKLTTYQVHRWTEAGERRYKCLMCDAMHGTHNAMYLHMLWKHRDQKFFKCPLCKDLVLIARGKRAHFEEFHSKEISTSSLKTSALQCQFCKKIFTGLGRKYQRSAHIKHAHSDTAVRCAWFNCCRYFPNRAAMEKHAYEKHNNVMARGKLRCIFCGAAYIESMTLNKHVKLKHKREAHFCPRRNCGKHFKTIKEMQAHVKEVHEKTIEDKKIVCTFCGHRISARSIHSHMRLKHPKEAFKCKKPVCCEYFTTKAAAAEHYQDTHVSEIHPYYKITRTCDTCEFQTRYRKSLESHIVAKHFPRTLKCPDCSKMFASEEHIKEHARKTHSKSRRKCPHCGIDPAIYNSHVVNTKCLKCCKPFKCFTLLKEHKISCKLSFVCDFCSKSFKLESALMVHFNAMHRKNSKNIWLGSKKHRKSLFKCAPCKIYFAHEGFLNTHLRFFHTDRNTCTCHICGKVVRCKSRMEYHLVHVHNILKRRTYKNHKNVKNVIWLCVQNTKIATVYSHNFDNKCAHLLFICTLIWICMSQLFLLNILIIILLFKICYILKKCKYKSEKICTNIIHLININKVFLTV